MLHEVKVKVTQLCPTLCNPMDSPWISPGQTIGVGSLSLLQGIFPTQGSNPGPPHCRWILYQLSHKGSPRILEWVAYPFSSGSSRPRNQTRVSCQAGDIAQSLVQEDPLEKEMATHSSILAWEISWREEPGGLQSTGLQRVGHN